MNVKSSLILLISLMVFSSQLALALPGEVVVRRLLEERKYEEAIKLLQSRLILVPKDTRARVLLGLALYNSGDQARAIFQWKRVKKGDTGFLESRWYLQKLKRAKNSLQNVMKKQLEKRREKLLREIGSKHSIASKQLLFLSDRDGDGFVTLKELSAIVQPKILQRLFLSADKNSDLKLTGSELKTVPFETLRPTIQPLVALDGDKDGKLTVDEVTEAVGDEETARRFISNLSAFANNLAVYRKHDIDGNKKLTAKELGKNAQEILAWSDADGDGVLHAREAHFLGAKPTGTSIQRIFSAFDTNKDGYLSRSELIAKSGREGASSILLLLDKNGDKKVSLGEHKNRTSPFSKKAKILRLDKNKDGLLQREELASALPQRLVNIFVRSHDHNRDRAISVSEITHKK